MMKTQTALVLMFLVAGLTSPFQAKASETPAELLKPYFGNFRVLSYNGVTNTYSRRFFAPTITIEPSLKLRQVNDDKVQVLILNFEVPRLEDEGIALRYLFLEAPLTEAVISAGKDQIEINFMGPIQVLEAKNWLSCELTANAKLQWESPTTLKIQLTRRAQTPCRDESHEILAEKLW